MDWNRAVERNREALEAIIASIAALLEASGGARITRAFHRAVLRLLHPAEAAVRRLIVIAARGLVVSPAPTRPAPRHPIKRGPARRLAFRLFDPRKRIGFGPRTSGPRLIPRIHVFGGDPRVAALWPAPHTIAPPPPDDGLIDGRRLVLRFEALRRALGDLPRQARRLARSLARRQQAERLRFVSPLRPGPPPGARRKPVLDVDFVLAECHGLARDALVADTS